MYAHSELIFVYNANSGVFAAASDFVKKLTRPDEYDCNLCLVTYGAVKMKNPWKEYLDTLPHQKTFLHKDEFVKRFNDSKVVFPAVLILESPCESPAVLVSADEINQVKNLQSLISVVNQKLQAGTE